MIHIPISENRITQFSALFEPHNGDFLYYGDNLLGGLPLSRQERGHYIANFARVLRISNLVMFGWVICAAIGLVVAEEGYHWPIENWQRALVFLLALPWVLWSWRKSRQIVLVD